MYLKEVVEKLLVLFHNRANKENSLLVGIDGLGGAGKTTFINKIKTELKNNNCEFVTFHIDNHIVERNKRYQTGHDEWYEYYYLQWDTEGLKNNLFEQLRNSKRSISLPFYNKVTDSSVTKQVGIPSCSIVLIEGVFLQRQEWRRFFDYVIFLEVPFELRCKRILNRDSYIGDSLEILRKYESRYWLGENYYLRFVKPVENADLIIKINDEKGGW